jgi:DNA-binding MarR family transcriptional regulator
VADLLHSAAIHLLRRARVVDRASGISPARLSALSVIVFTGPLTVGALAEAESVRSSTMTGIVNGLEEAGQVRRKPHSTDQRAVMVQATAAGRRALRQARIRRIESIARGLDGLSRQELGDLWRAGQQMERAFGSSDDVWVPVDE